jgi:cytochrome c oxidase subunit 4
MSGHIAPRGLYYLIFLALLVLTSLTVGLDLVDLGSANFVVAMVIAITKALLVVFYFMGLRWSSRLTHVTAMSGVLFLAILFTFTLTDYFTRGLLNVPGK